MGVPLLVLLPPVAAVFSVSVIATCISLAKEHGHIPLYIRYPPISFAGIYSPEYYVFSAGFVGIALFLAIIEACFWSKFSAHMPPLPLAEVAAAAAPDAAPADGASTPESERAALGLPFARLIARLGFFALAVTGVVPLQGWGGTATAVHQFASLIFFAGALYYGHTFSQALRSPCLADHPLHISRAPLLWGLKAFILLNAFLAFVPAQLLHPGGTPQNPHPGGAEAASIDTAGFGQWWTVGSIGGYFLFKAGDFFVLRHRPQQLVQPAGGADASDPMELAAKKTA